MQSWDWRRLPATSSELLQLQSCSAFVQQTVLSQDAETWSWVDSKDGKFSVAECRNMLTKHAVPFPPFQWIKGVPKKVSIFGWRAAQDRLPTRVGLKRRKMIQGDSLCKICGEGEEDADHLFTSCYMASMIWQKISIWCNIPPIYAFTMKDLLQIHNNIGENGRKKKLIRVVIIAACWIIWKARNELIFAGKRTNLDAIFSEIQATTYTWVKHRLKGEDWNWEKWVNFEIPIT